MSKGYETTLPASTQFVLTKPQAKLQEASARPRSQVESVSSHNKIGAAPLTGKLRDETGDRLTPTHTQRHGRRLRYYVSNRLISGGTDALVAIRNSGQIVSKTA